MERRRIVVLAGVALAALAGESTARPAPARIEVTSVAPYRSGWLRVAVRFEGVRRPSLRLVPICGAPDSGQSVIGARVTVAARRRQAFLDLPEDLAWLTDRRRQPCPVTGVAVEMLRGTTVVAQATVPVALPPAYPPPALADARPREDAPRLGFTTDKRTGPEAQSAEAGVRWSLHEHVALGLSFERTTLGHAVPLDPGNGFRTSVRIGF